MPEPVVTTLNIPVPVSKAVEMFLDCRQASGDSMIDDSWSFVEAAIVLFDRLYTPMGEKEEGVKPCGSHWKQVFSEMPRAMKNPQGRRYWFWQYRPRVMQSGKEGILLLDL